MDMNEAAQKLKEMLGVSFRFVKEPESNLAVAVTERNSSGIYLMLSEKWIGIYSTVPGGYDINYYNADNVAEFQRDYKEVFTRIKIDTYPEERERLEMGEAFRLLEWQDENDLLINMTKDEASAIIDTLKQEGISLYTEDGKIYAKKKEERCYTLGIDDVIDLACEANYEKICTLKEELSTAKECTEEEYTKSLNQFGELLKLEATKKYLYGAYSKTIYTQQVEYSMKPALRPPKAIR